MSEEIKWVVTYTHEELVAEVQRAVYVAQECTEKQVLLNLHHGLIPVILSDGTLGWTGTEEQIYKANEAVKTLYANYGFAMEGDSGIS